jgi:hypothetical protein
VYASFVFLFRFYLFVRFKRKQCILKIAPYVKDIDAIYAYGRYFVDNVSFGLVSLTNHFVAIIVQFIEGVMIVIEGLRLDHYHHAISKAR